MRKTNQTKNYLFTLIICTTLLIISFLFDLIGLNKQVLQLKWPDNLSVGLSFILLTIAANFIFKGTRFIKWSSSIPAAIGTLLCFLVSGSLMGFIAQGTESETELINTLGYNNMSSTYTYTLSSLLLLYVLLMTIIKRISPFNFRNFAFTLNHLGLFIAVFSASLGSGDLIRLDMYLEEEQATWKAYDKDKNEYNLGFALYLKDFKIEEYEPKLAIIDLHKEEVIHLEGKNIYHINDSVQGVIQGIQFKVEHYYYESGLIGNRFAPVNEPGAVPSANITFYNESDTVNGWVSCGNFMYPAISVKFNDDYAFHMLPPQIKKYTSEILYDNRNEEQGEFLLEVNKPYTINGWKIYQVSYDEGLGKWSTKSQLELIKDPWLPVVYIGIFLMIAGAILLFWSGNKYINEK